MRKYTPQTHPVVAIDLDGTIAPEESFPELGTPYKYAIKTINDMVEEGYEVIIWTAREWENAKQAFSKLGSKYGLNIHSLKLNVHSDYYKALFPASSPKVNAHVFLDDKSYGAPKYEHHWDQLHKEFLGKEVE